jgi:hypothetical protein
MPRVKRNATNEGVDVGKLEKYAERYDRLARIMHGGWRA